MDDSYPTLPTCTLCTYVLHVHMYIHRDTTDCIDVHVHYPPYMSLFYAYYIKVTYKIMYMYKYINLICQFLMHIILLLGKWSGHGIEHNVNEAL